MKLLSRLAHDETGGPAAEFALVLPVALLFLAGIIDVGRYMWETNRAEKATQMGARFAIATDFVPGGTSENGLYKYSFAVSSGITQGIPVSASDFPGVRCDSNGTAVTCTCKGTCAFDVTGDNAVFSRIVARMQAFKSDIGPANVVLNYDHSNLGFSGDPAGADVAPIVTVGLRNMNFVPLTTMLFGGATTMAGASTSNNSPLGHLTYSLTMEDGQGTYSN
ncbi:MAG TPA: pilus assembly protein [Sphingorhabdus sp.]|jgi:hypothetical protein|uniref:TadE/TadG family type IV pilus assembly protein n=1 Tax=Sphingorhabdus sp. TaxID=1902408 RepID=UPI002C555CE6|nr:TadE family protein [Sphingorhabdus sp.]HMT41009.1 pilus assembly protein [Sphingorhabdus sp.]HMU21963.1 pilus assembly protein [Sphingorhabdus sp.]